MNTIMLVDDEEDLRCGLHMLLEMEGFSVHEAENGRIALELLKQGIEPDLMLVDLMMPELDGASLCRAIRLDPHLRGLRLLVISGRHDAAEQAASCGADGFMGKPIAFDKLLAEVRAYTNTKLERFGAFGSPTAK